MVYVNELRGLPEKQAPKPKKKRVKKNADGNLPVSEKLVQPEAGRD